MPSLEAENLPERMRAAVSTGLGRGRTKLTDCNDLENSLFFPVFDLRSAFSLAKRDA